MKKIFLFLFFIFLNCPAFSFEGSSKYYFRNTKEYVESFDVSLNVQKDGSIVVSENIRVYHDGTIIKRGLVRDLPSTKGEIYKVLDVLRNGKPEPYFVEYLPEGISINTGDDSFLPDKQISVFTITYQVWGAIRSYDGFDEVYWNVIGNDFIFPIHKGSVTLQLPQGAQIFQKQVYAEYPYTLQPTSNDEQGYVHWSFTPSKTKGLFTNTEPFTIAAGFTPNIVDTGYKPFFRSLLFPVSKLFIFSAFLLLLIYFIVTWVLFGKDPKGKAIMPQYTPPKDMTPTEALLLYEQGDPSLDKLLMVTFSQFLTSGFLTVRKKKPDEYPMLDKETYIFNRTKKDAETEEEIECDKIVKTSLILEKGPSDRMSSYAMRIKTKFAHQMKEKYYRKNSYFISIPLFVYFYIMILFCIHSIAPSSDLFIEKIVMSFSLFLILMDLIKHIIFAPTVKKILKSTIISSVICFSLWRFDFLSFFEAIFVSLTLYCFSIYSYLIYKPSKEGKRIIEHIQGLKMFLETAGLSTNSTSKSIVDVKMMENLFPYALLLGLEKEWNRKFKKIFNTQDIRKSHSFFSTNSTVFNLKFYRCLGISSRPSTNKVLLRLGNNLGRGSASFGGGCAGGGFGGGGLGGR